MNRIHHPFEAASRWLAMAAVSALGLTGMDTRALTLTSPPAPSAPAKPAAAPAQPAAQTQSLAGEDIRDIRPPYHIPPGWQWLAWAGGGLALLALGYGAWRWRHQLGVRAKLPYELALEQLEAARRWMQPEHAREFSIAVSEAVRAYIENCFPVRAAHHTTEEFLRDLATRQDSPLIAYQPVLAEFLRHCDLAKFARWVLSVPQMEAMLQSARSFLLATGRPTAELSPTQPADKPSSPPSPGSPVAAPVSFSRVGSGPAAASTLHPQTS